MTDTLPAVSARGHALPPVSGASWSGTGFAAGPYPAPNDRPPPAETDLRTREASSPVAGPP
ncbi:hypothetical protein STAL104432_31450 [Streptomyces albus]